MNNRLKKILQCTIFIVMLIATITVVSEGLEKKDARIKFTPFYESETNFDVLFFGTSHMHNHILPMEMWKEYGIASFNWGYSNCTQVECYYLMKEALKYTSPQVVVIDLYGLIEYEHYGNGKYRTDRIEQQHVLFDDMPLSINKVEAVYDIFDDYNDNNDFLWNFAMYHNRWTELGQEDFDYEISTEKGACYNLGLGVTKYYPTNDLQPLEGDIDTVCYDYLLKTLEYCEENDIQCLVVYLPLVAGTEGQQIAESIGPVVESYKNCKYINMLDKNIVNFETDVSTDGYHLNYSGALKTTSWLGDYLVENYELENYKENPHWISDYDRYYMHNQNVLLEQNEIENYLIMLESSDFEATLWVYSEELLTNTKLLQLAENAGVKVEYKTGVSSCSAQLMIASKYTGEEVENVSFLYEGTCNSIGVPEMTKLVE